MSITLGERVLEAIGALVRQVRTNAGWMTEVGADVRIAEDSVAVDSNTRWLTTVSTREEVPRVQSGRVVRAVRRFELDHGVAVEAYARVESIPAERLLLRMSSDLRKALATADGSLSDADGRLGVIELLPSEPIREHLTGGVIGVRANINVTRIEGWGDPSTAL
jgi:hypothetical protein